MTKNRKRVLLVAVGAVLFIAISIIVLAHEIAHNPNAMPTPGKIAFVVLGIIGVALLSIVRKIRDETIILLVLMIGGGIVAAVAIIALAWGVSFLF